MEFLPYIFLQNRVLHLRVDATAGYSFHKGTSHMLQTPDGKRWDIVIIDRVPTGTGVIYPFTLCRADPVAFVNETCKNPDNPKRRQKVVIGFLDGGGNSFQAMPEVELHPR